MKLKVITDGSIIGSHWASKKVARTLPHCYGGWIIKTQLDMAIKWHCLDMGENEKYSANVAEYGALRSALFWCSQNFPLASLDIYSDSQVVMRQMTGEYNCFKQELLTFKTECDRLASMFPIVTYNWHPRETPDAKLADFMSKCLQSKYGGKIPETWEEFQGQLNAKRTGK
jgi:ribonuclease HI